MELGNPSALYLFSLLGVILIYYLLKEKKRRLEVSSIMLWERVSAPPSTSRPRWRIESEPLLYLHLLILVLLVSALLAPQLVLPGQADSGRMLLVIDRSASMQATDLDPDRFTAAVHRAKERVDAASPGTEFAVVSASFRPELVLDFTSDRGQVQAALRSLQASDGELALEESLQLSASIAAAAGAEILFFTDGTFPELPYRGQAPLEVIQVGESGNNIGITALDVRAEAAGGEYQLQVVIKNTGSEPREVALKITDTLEQEGLKTRTLNLEAADQKTVTLQLPGRTRTPFLLELDEGGLLAVDSRAVVLTGPGRPVRTLLIGPGNFFLERALITLDHIRVFTQREVPSDLTGYDLVIFDRVEPPSDFSGHALFIDTAPPGLKARARDGEVTLASGWQEEHPLLRFVDVSELQVRNVLPLEEGDRGDTLISSPAGPLLQIVSRENYRGLFFAFRLQDSSLPLQAGFPVLIANTLEWFFPHVYRPEAVHRRPGQDFTLYHRPTSQALAALSPEGAEIQPVPFTTHSVFTGLQSSGLYQLEQPDGERDFLAVNLLSEKETRIRPQFSSKVLEGTAGEEFQHQRELWPPLVFFLFVLLAGEWYLKYNQTRR